MAHPSYNPHTGATAQDIATAIAASREADGEIVAVEHATEATHSQLYDECESQNVVSEHEGGPGVVYLGQDCDGNEWRVFAAQDFAD